MSLDSDTIKLVKILLENFEDYAIDSWLDAPALYLGGMTPRKVWDSGEHEMVFETLEALLNGIYL